MKSNELKKHFASKERVFFDSQLRQFLQTTDTVLKIGNGFGYLSTYIAEYVDKVDIFEVEIFPKTINKADVQLYDGENLPVPDKSYDVTIFNLVLHHIPNNISYLKNVISKTKGTVILYEQTYDNLGQKLDLVWRDWWINLKAGTPCKIHWNSYFRRSDIENQLSPLGLKVIHRESKRSHLYYKELLVLKIIA